MAKKQNARKTQSATEATTGTYESMMKGLSALQNKFEIPESAREFVKRGTATAKERVAALHEGANKAVGVIEGGIIDAVSGVAELNRKLIEEAHDDTGAALAAMDKLASAKSVAEAYQLYVSFLRERGEVAAARAKSSAAFVNAKVCEGAKAVQNGVARIAPGLVQAA
jgi:hypothetical protein